MKKIFFYLFLLFFGLSGCTFNGPWETTGDKYYSGLKKSEAFTAFKIPVRLAYLAVPAHEKEARQVLKEVHSIGVMVLKDGSHPGENLRLGAAMHSSFSQRGYEDMMTIVQSGQKIHVNVLEENGKIRELIMIVASEDEFLLIKLKGRISPQNFVNFANKYQS